MHSAGSRRLTSLILASLGFFLVAADAPLAATASADVVLVREGEIVDEDLYALGNTITIDGVIEGDLVFFAYDRIDIRGAVKGDVIGVAPIVRISGQVGGSVRLVGLDLSTAGEVGSDVFAAGWKVTTAGSVGRDVLAWTRSLTINGSVGRDVEGQTWGPTVIGGSIGRDVEMTVSSMELLAGAYVGQDLGYRSDLAAVIDAEAGVGGAIVQREPVSPNVSVSAARMVAFVLGLVGFLWLGIMSIWVMPATMERAVGLVRSDVLRTAASALRQSSHRL